MKKLQWIVALLITTNISLFTADLDFGGYIRNYNGLIVSEDMEFAVLQNSFDLTMDSYSSKGGMLVNPYLSLNENEIEALDLREIYVDLYFDSVDLRIGRQQIIWGKGDGLFITDVVSPKNLQEFILPDFREIRIGVDAIKLDYFLGSSTLEAIWIPLFTPNTMPDADSIWNTKGIDFSGSDDDIEMSLENSEFFGRYSLMTSVFDLEIVGGSMWDDEPLITLEHKRLAMVGGSISSTIGDFVLRSEGAYYTGKGFYNDSGTLYESDYIHYMFGLDYSISGYKISTQFIQKNIVDGDYENTITFMVNKTFLGDTLTTELFTYVELNDLNALLKPKVTYDFDDGISLILGAYIFTGDSGTYGQFDDNDIIYTQVKYTF